jgi:hypothetical protein
MQCGAISSPLVLGKHCLPAHHNDLKARAIGMSPVSQWMDDDGPERTSHKVTIMLTLIRSLFPT